MLGTKTSKSLTVHSAVAPDGLTYISVPTLIEVHTLFAGCVPGSCTRATNRVKLRAFQFSRSIHTKSQRKYQENKSESTLVHLNDFITLLKFNKISSSNVHT